jgi:hypothetical protein
MTFLTELRELEAKATAPVDSTASFCDVGESNQKLALFLRNHSKEIINLVEAAESAKNDIHGARLCEFNSMSSRGEMLRLMSNATGKLGDALAALDKKPIDPNKWAFDRGLESY